MKKFIAKILVFSILLYSLDYIFSIFLQQYRPDDYKLFLDSKKEIYYKKNHVEILVLGDSHIADAIDPYIIEHITKKPAYNMGVYGASMFENYYLLEDLIRNHKIPNYLLIGITPEKLSKKNVVGRYMPLIIQNKVVKWKMYLNSEKIKLEYFSASAREKYLFSSLIKKIRKTKTENNRDINRIFNGYLEHTNNININELDTSDFTRLRNSEIKRIQIEYLENILSLAKQEKITVFILNPPTYENRITSVKSYEQYINNILELNKKYEFNYYLSEQHPSDLTLNYNEFLDPMHLNYLGALKYSTLISNLINSRLYN